jgi:hypothetical protein
MHSASTAGLGVCLVADEVICVVYPDESTRAEWNRISKIMAFDEIVRTDIKKNQDIVLVGRADTIHLGPCLVREVKIFRCYIRCVESMLEGVFGY